MIFVFEDGRVRYGDIPEVEKKNAVAVEGLPDMPPVPGKVPVVTGADIKTGEIFFEYFDIREPAPEPDLPTSAADPPARTVTAGELLDNQLLIMSLLLDGAYRTALSGLDLGLGVSM